MFLDSIKQHVNGTVIWSKKGGNRNFRFIAIKNINMTMKCNPACGERLVTGHWPVLYDVIYNIVYTQCSVFLHGHDRIETLFI